MTVLCIALGIVAWAGCGALAWGVSVACDARRWPSLYYVTAYRTAYPTLAECRGPEAVESFVQGWRKSHYRFAAPTAALGPIGLFSVLLAQGWATPRWTFGARP